MLPEQPFCAEGECSFSCRSLSSPPPPRPMPSTTLAPPYVQLPPVRAPVPTCLATQKPERTKSYPIVVYRAGAAAAPSRPRPASPRGPNISAHPPHTPTSDPPPQKVSRPALGPFWPLGRHETGPAAPNGTYSTCNFRAIGAGQANFDDAEELVSKSARQEDQEAGATLNIDNAPQGTGDQHAGAARDFRGPDGAADGRR